jgi:hypothetical protein
MSPDSPMVAFRMAKALVALGQIQVRLLLPLCPLPFSLASSLTPSC